MTQNPFNICKLGWVGVPVFWSGTVWTTAPTFNPDGSPLVIGVPRDISLWTFRLRVKASYSVPDSAAIYAPADLQIGAGLGTNGQWGPFEMGSAITVTLRGGTTLVWDLKALVYPATEPTELAGGTVAIGYTAGTDLFTG
jgi:hypothetical protein